MIYISLTTVPHRLSNGDMFEQNLNSLLYQKTDKEYFIILSIPNIYIKTNTEYVIPDELMEITENNPRLIINTNTPDHGSITKIIGALKYATDPNDIIIAVNDHYVYHEDMLEYHIKKLNEYPHHVICFKGEEGIDKRRWTDENGIKKFVVRPWPLLWPTDKDRYLMVPYHEYSISYKREYFKDDFNSEIWGLSDNEDLIMAYYLKLQEIWSICSKWDREIDFRPNFHRLTFPIIKRLSYSLHTEDNLPKNNYGSYLSRGPEIIRKLLYNFNSAEGKAKYIYTEKT
jgi:hypothetical protein